MQVTAVKKQIEESQGKESFPCSQQLLIHQGKVLKDDTSMEDNKVSENGFLVVMLTKVSFCSSSDESIRAINMSEQIDAAGQISLCRHVAVSSKPLIVFEMWDSKVTDLKQSAKELNFVECNITYKGTCTPSWYICCYLVCNEAVKSFDWQFVPIQSSQKNTDVPALKSVSPM